MRPLGLFRESLEVQQEGCRKQQVITFGMFHETMVHL